MGFIVAYLKDFVIKNLGKKNIEDARTLKFRHFPCRLLMGLQIGMTSMEGNMTISIKVKMYISFDSGNHF